MSKAIGTLLRALSAIWIAFAVLRILAGLTGLTRGMDIAVGFIGLLIAFATFKLGTWLKYRQPGPPVAQRLQSAKSAWWRADYGFRLSVFLGVIWAVGCYFWQDDYGRNLGLVFWPPLGLLLAYLGYRKLVVGSSAAHGAVEPSHAEASSTAATPTTPTPSNSESQLETSIAAQTSKDRERAMSELINRMK